MALLDLLSRRTCLRILWELRAKALTFRALQEAAQTNPSALNTRLAELKEARIVDGGPDGYMLTREGKTLLEILMPLARWSERWAERLERED
jgi:DNA-binding HxlR family transcriptional regulator